MPVASDRARREELVRTTVDPPRPRTSVVSLLDDLEREPGRPAFALRTPYRRFLWTAGETRNAALTLADRLRAGGVRPSDRVLLRGPDGPEWVAAFLGIAAAGAIAVPLDRTTAASFVEKVAARTGSRAAVVAAGEIDSLPAAVFHRETLESLGLFRATTGPLPPPHRATPHETAEIVFTSGTTAEPKGVELSHANLLSALAGIEAGFRKRERLLRPFLPMRFLCLVPLSHLFGQSLGIFVPVLLRSTAVFSSSLAPGRLADVLRREHPLAVVVVPRVLAALRETTLREVDRRGRRPALDRALARAEGRAAWRRVVAARSVHRAVGWRTWVFVVGGAALDPRLERFWSGSGFAVVQGYGMTEAAPIVAVHNPLDGAIGTLGRPLGNLEVRIADDGEVLVRGPNVMKGYWDDPEATRTALQDGWLRTGDLAERDTEGRLRFRGRKKDVIVLPSGLNVHPSDVEAALEAMRDVRGAVAFSGAGASGEEVHASVLAPPSVDPEAIRTSANTRLAPHQRIRKLSVWPGHDFPRTATGKVRRGDVAAATRTKGLQASEVHRPGIAVPTVASTIAAVRGGAADEILPDARLVEDLGLESLDVLDVVGRIEEELGASVPDAALDASLTVGRLERIVAASRSEGAPDIPMPRWSQSLVVRCLRGAVRGILLRPLHRLFVRMDVEGLDRIRRVAGPVLVVANHASMLDAATVAFALPPRLGARLTPAMAVEPLEDHYHPRGSRWHRRLRASVSYGVATALFAAYPMPQSRGYRPSLEYTGELVDRGFSPLVFPQGRMVPAGETAPFKPGIGRLAREIGVPILPVRLEGLAEILPPGARWPRRGRARIVFGELLEPPRDGGEDPARVARRIETAVRSLGREPGAAVGDSHD